MVHTGGGRRRGKSRPRILYWFRTPPGVRIGRSALDESAIRLIEEHNPDVEFDWTRILKGQEAPAEEKRPPQPDRRGKPRPRDFSPRPAPTPVGLSTETFPPVDRTPVAPPVDIVEPPGFVAQASLEGSGDSFDLVEDASPAVADQPEVSVMPSLEAVSGSLDEAAIDELLADSTVPPMQGAQLPQAQTPAEARLGSEGLSRLRARHAEVLARISEAVTDPVRREELKSQADRLNPDTWVLDAEVTEGLEAYETVFESLRTVVGRRGKRRRRSGRPKGQTSAGGLQQTDSSPESAGDGESDAQDAGEDL